MYNKQELGSADRILRAALELFCDAEPAQVSLKDITKRAGLSMGTLTHYFPSRTDLELECYREVRKMSVEFQQRLKDLAEQLRFSMWMKAAVREGFHWARMVHGGCKTGRLLKGQIDTPFSITEERQQLVEFLLMQILRNTDFNRNKAVIIVEEIVQLITRYASASQSELSVWTNTPKQTLEETLKSAENLLLEAAHRLLQVKLDPVSAPL